LKIIDDIPFHAVGLCLSPDYTIYLELEVLRPELRNLLVKYECAPVKGLANVVSPPDPDRLELGLANTCGQANVAFAIDQVGNLVDDVVAI